MFSGSWLSKLFFPLPVAFVVFLLCDKFVATEEFDCGDFSAVVAGGLLVLGFYVVMLNCRRRTPIPKISKRFDKVDYACTAAQQYLDPSASLSDAETESTIDCESAASPSSIHSDSDEDIDATEWQAVAWCLSTVFRHDSKHEDDVNAAESAAPCGCKASDLKVDDTQFNLEEWQNVASRLSDIFQDSKPCVASRQVYISDEATP